MPENPTKPELDRFAWGIIHLKVDQLIGRVGFTEQDREDLLQELAFHLFQRLPAFDPSQGHQNVFVATVIERFVANIIRDRMVQIRNRRKTFSLDELQERGANGATRERSEPLDERPYTEARGIRPPSAEKRAELQLDVQAVLRRLPLRLRDLAVRLQTQSVTEIARELRVSRSTIARRVARLRVWFEGAGLGKNL